MGFSKQEYPPSGDLPNPGIEPTFLASPALAGRFLTTSATWEALLGTCVQVKEVAFTEFLPLQETC